jgi:tetratricopeptide (TPR) repeat protein
MQKLNLQPIVWIPILFLITWSPAHSYSQQHCNRPLEARLEATTAKDYNRALQLSLDFEKECNSVVDLDSLTSAVDSQAHAFLMLKNPAKALSTADRCLALNSNGECYSTRGLALVALGRFDEGLASIQEAKRSLIAEIAVVDIAMRRASQ